MKVITKTKQLHANIDEVWNFFLDPRHITHYYPKRFHIQTNPENPDNIYSGDALIYKLFYSFIKIPIIVAMEFRNVKEKEFFVVYQLQGFYKVYHHQVFLTPNEKGVIIKDVIHYHYNISSQIALLAFDSFLMLSMKKQLKTRDKYLDKVFNK